jgi:hypothetical protein
VNYGGRFHHEDPCLSSPDNIWIEVFEGEESDEPKLPDEVLRFEADVLLMRKLQSGEGRMTSGDDPFLGL